MNFLIFLLLLVLVEALDKKGSYFAHNVDLLNKTYSQNWLIESFKSKSKMMCLGKCNLHNNCTNVIFNIDQTSPFDCFLYSKNFTKNELVYLNISKMYFQLCDSSRSVGNEHFWNGSICEIASAYQQACTIGSDDSCQYLTQNTYCDTTSGLCQCNSTNFWDGTSCVPPYTYNNQTCTNSSQCASPLVCNLNETSCNCPDTVPINKCDCSRSIGNEYYWNGVTCVLAGAYGESCTIGSNYTCQYLTQNTFCDSSTGLCGCGSNGLWNSSTCLYCPTN